MPELVVLKQLDIGCQFAAGDLVTLKSGSVAMDVTEIFPPLKTGQPWFVKVSWHDASEVPQEADYPVTVLKKWAPPRSKVKAKRRPKPSEDYEIVFTPWKAKK